MQKIRNILAFTLVELIVAIMISAIILLGVLGFVGETIYSLAASNNYSNNIIYLGKINEQLNDFNSVYEKKTLFVNNVAGEGTDIVLFTDSGSTSGVLFGLVDLQTNTFFTGSTNYKLYSKRQIGYKQLTQTELTLLLGDSSRLYDYTIFNDKIYSDVFLSDFQVNLYNTGTIGNLNISMLLKYERDKEGISWEVIGKKGIYNINLNF